MCIKLLNESAFSSVFLIQIFESISGGTQVILFSKYMRSICLQCNPKQFGRRQEQELVLSSLSNYGVHSNLIEDLNRKQSSLLTF